MLFEISVKDFVLLDDLHLRFSPGLNVITGETGAGKSLLIDALGVATGSRALTDYVRQGQDSAHVTASFLVKGCLPALEWLSDAGIEPEEGLVLLSRDVYKKGPSSARINGQSVTLTQLAEMAGLLLEVHGQAQQHSLVQPARQRQLLDRFGGRELHSTSREVARQYGELSLLQAERDEVGGAESDRARRIDWLSYEIQEIKAAGLEPGEEEELLAQKRILANLEQLRELVAGAYGLLRGQEASTEAPSVLENLGRAAQDLERASLVDESLKGASAAALEASIGLEETAMDLRRYLEDLSLDPGELDRVEKRLSLIADLKRKYGDSVEAILEHLARVEKEKRDLEGHETRALELDREIQGRRETLGKACARLSALRQEAAGQLAELVMEELGKLNMKGARFQVRFWTEEEEGGLPVGSKSLRAGEWGIDRLEFVLAANPGQPLRPLSRTASGGELARIMLALKTVLADVDRVPAVVFDEVDAGVGGITARRVAERLARLSQKRQVLCVTHLAPIAALADSHFAIEKVAEDGISTTSIRLLCSQDRSRELARMMAAGSGGAAHKHAQELLKEAQEFRDLTQGRSSRG